ncbi:MAG TPA: hopanoid biosynthesis-associated protein HpnK [Caulobacteraceae bacterium]
MSRRRLIITADDFGASEAVNEAVEIAHREGVLTAASLMVSGPAASDAVERARKLPSLRIGLHLVLVEGRPTLPAVQLHHLTAADGNFRSNMAEAGATMFFHPAARRELAAEVEAQFKAFADTGLPLDHVNAHKHFHLHPTIAGLAIAVGRRHGLRAMRAPVEPIQSLKAIEPHRPVRPDPLFETFARALRRRARRAGLQTPDQVFGLRWSGQLTEARLSALIAGLPEGLSEIYLHPATRGDFEGSAYGLFHAEELAALTSPNAARALAQSGARTGGYADFAL